jgi:8-amino-3,8-dideoxy-alpha-D-manno-octulosonate transaminase
MPGFEIFGAEERKEVMDVLETGVLFRYGFDAARKGHWKARTFEKELADRLGVGHGLLLSSGTAALCTALAACGIGAGDEVVVPPFTFVATFEAVLAVGAVPVFAEIDDTLCLDPGCIEAVLTPRTRAVLPVHMCGAMAQIDRLAEICRDKGLMLIEDACQALGGTFNGQPLGTFGKVGCFSFDAVKTITCGEGGGLVTDDAEVYRRADAYADHGHDHIGDDRGREDHPILGTNYRISELNAAVGLAQLRKLDEILLRQRAAKAAIQDALAGIDGIALRRIPDPSGDSATFLSFFLPTEATARRAAAELAENGVDGCPYWYDNGWHYIRQWEHLKKRQTAAPMSVFAGSAPPDYENLQLPASDAVMGRLISMQIKLGWGEKDIAERIEKMTTVLKAVLA